VFCAAAAAGCGGTSASPTAPSASTDSTSSSGGTAGTSSTGVTTYTYTADVKPILTSDCIRCHNTSQHEAGYDFTTYAGVMRAVTPGSSRSLLVRAVQSNGIMYPELSGNRAQKSQIITDWVVSSGAAQ